MTGLPRNQELPLDQEARDRALDPRESFHLEAPAGSGKTSVLLARFLTLLARVDAPEELLALTFTRKAAGELRARIMQLLGPGAEPRPDASPMDRKLADLAQEVFRHFSRQRVPLQEVLTPERLPVMTFHGFCARLLPLAPQESGVPLEFRLVEEEEAEWLKQEALEEMRRQLAARPADDPVRRAMVNRLVRLNNSWWRLAQELRDLLDRRDTLGDFLTLARESRDLEAYSALMTHRLATVLSPDLAFLSRELANSPLGQVWPALREGLRQKAHPLAESLPPDPPQDTLADLIHWQALARLLLTQKREVYKKFSPQKGFPSGFAEILGALSPEFFTRLAGYRDLPPELLYTEEVAALHDLILLLWEAMAVYGDLCRRKSVLDFIDLEMATLKLLAAESPSELLLRLDWRLKHLLVDEFQDTSENQKILLCRLLSGWEAGTGRTLTVVGDPKQSIYGWRKAKLSLFLESRHGLRCESGVIFPLQPLYLTTNFRATRTLITWVNEVFGRTVMKFDQGPDRLVFQAASPSPEAEAGQSPHLALFVDRDSSAARLAEARWLARRLLQALTERARKDETIGVLLFARTHLKVYREALQQAGLSVRVREGLKLADSPAVQHLHNLVKALVRPHDDVAWAALLAGPWGPQPMAVIVRAAQAPGVLWHEKLGALSKEHACPPELTHLIEALREAREQTGRRSLHEILQDFLNRVDAWAGIAGREGAAGVANARAYLDLLAAAESGIPETTFLKADFHLEAAYQPPDPRAQDSPVELLTVHSAKGLEFDWVFLPYLDWQPLKMGGNLPPPFILEEIPGTSSYGLALAPPYWQPTPSLLYLSLRNLRDFRVLAEARRLFYVAATRARKRLLLSGVAGRGDSGQPLPPPHSPLAWLWQHYRPESRLCQGLRTLADPELHLELWQDLPEVEKQEAKPLEIPPSLGFTAEATPYVLVFPSQLAQEGEAGADSEAMSAERDSVSEDRYARLRGEVIHALLETASDGLPLPKAEGVAAALRQGGMARDAAAQAAAEILAEVEACLADPFLAPLLSPDLQAKSEWLVEDTPGAGFIRRGRIDRFVHDGERWWLVDYKTSRPEKGQDWEAFMADEVRKYRPQLIAYRDMAAKAKGLAPEAINAVLYFTVCQRAWIL
uniref:DNA 3'-5' helicase n=1 Tax=Desulfobacca acetoxidans TaxID=60893 RepID=A0A7C3SIW5_9BACT